MDRTGRVLRGHGKVGEGQGPATRTGRGRTAIPIAGAAGGRRTITASAESLTAKKVPTSRMKGNISPVGKRTDSTRTRISPSRTRTSPSRTRTSPSRTRTSPVRRSSRPRSTIPTVQVTSAPKSSKLSSTKEDEEVEEEKEKLNKQSNLPSTLTTNTSTKAPNRITTTSSTHSSYSSITQKTIEIRTSSDEPSDITKLTDFIRRSVSKTFSLGGGTNEEREASATPSQRTDGGSRYSRSVSRSVYDNDDRYSKAEFSDTETNDQDAGIYEEDGAEEEPFKSFNVASAARVTSLCRKLPIPKEFGGWFGALLLMLTIPCLVYYLQWCCTVQSCDFKLPDYKDILDANEWGPKIFNFESVGLYLAFNFGIFVLSAVLLGRGVRLPGCVEYKFNSLPMTIIVSVIYAGSVYFKYPVADIVLKNYVRFGVYSLLNAYVLALWAYVRSDVLKQKDSQCNIYAKSGNFVIDYALGRQLNPKWLGLVNFKMVFYRVSQISVFLHAVSLLYKNIQTPWIPKDVSGIEIISFFFNHLKYDTTSMVCAVMVLIYILDSIIFEHHLASSFEMQGEGFGCLLLLRYAATPLLLTSVAKYFYDNHTPLTCKFAVYVPLLLLAIGLALKRFSNAIKYKYRVQPNHPHFLNIETIHTFQGRRLLLGSLWGRLRQPNYLGDILCLVALGLPLALRFSWPPLISLLLIVIVLIHRCFRVNDRNAARYHSSWVRYRSIARNYLIPKIF